MNSIEINARIKLLQTQITEAEQGYIRELASYNGWVASAQKPCNFTLKNKQAECVADRANSMVIAKTRNAAALSYQATAVRKTGELKTLQATLGSINTQAETLAGKGIVYEAQVVEAQGKADAAEITAQGAAQAQADAQKSEQTRKTLITVVVVVVVSGIAVVLIRKRMKK